MYSVLLLSNSAFFAPNENGNFHKYIDIVVKNTVALSDTRMNLSNVSKEVMQSQQRSRPV